MTKTSFPLTLPSPLGGEGRVRGDSKYLRLEFICYLVLRIWNFRIDYPYLILGSAIP
jgi:hypothetical protein